MDSARPHPLSVFAVASSTFSSAWMHGWMHGWMDGRRKGCGHPDHASSRRRGREEGVHGDRNFKTAQL